MSAISTITTFISRRVQTPGRHWPLFIALRRRFELQINGPKTEIIEVPEPIEPAWKTFDDGISLIETGANDLLVEYGLPIISSALTATLPYAPVPWATLPSSGVALDDRDYGPPQQWAEFDVTQGQETLLPGFTAWAYDFQLDSGSQSPLIPNLAQNGTAALYSQLLAYQQNQTPLTFDEFAYQFNTQTGQTFAGLGYRATAFITDVQQTPEPCSFAMISGPAVALYLLNYAYKAKGCKL